VIEEAGYLYVNLGNEWPGVQLTPALENAGGFLRLRPAGSGFETGGAFLAGPFQVSDQPVSWFRVEARLGEPAGSPAAPVHVRFFTFSSPGPPAPWNPAGESPFSDPGWSAAPGNALDFHANVPPGQRFFLGGVLRGDGNASPQIEQIRIFHGRDTYARFLPPIYREDAAARDFLERFLSIGQSVFGGIEDRIGDLPLLFDPYASPHGDPPSWLTWLSGWLTFVLDEHWTDAQAREYLAQAFQLYGLRGTLEGLRRYLKIYAGVNAHIEEAAQQTYIWSLGQAGMLGFSTMLAPGPLQGAVLDASATLDQSHLTTGAEFGAALFEDVAHRFCVRVYCGELTRPGLLETVRAVIDREKPAHTEYELCVIGPQMRVGIQARVGIDSIVAAGPRGAATGKPLGDGVLAASPSPEDGDQTPGVPVQQLCGE